MSGTVLVLGANGRFGRAAKDAFWNAGWKIRCFDRSLSDLGAVATGADVIVNAWNPPYDRWAAEVPGLTAQVIEAAKASGATVILPGNVYVFGPDAPYLYSEHTPHRASNALGKIRIDLESAYRASGVQTILLRCGDFIDTRDSGNWFDRVICAKLGRGRFVYPGDPDVLHAWAWLPDAARAAVGLAEMRTMLGTFEDVPFPGFTLTGRDLAWLVEEALDLKIALTRMSWLPLMLAAPFWPLGRHLLEMRYLWSKPHALDGSRFDALLPGFAHTTPEVALARALGHIEIDPDKPMPGQARVAAAHEG